VLKKKYRGLNHVSDEALAKAQDAGSGREAPFFNSLLSMMRVVSKIRKALSMSWSAAAGQRPEKRSHAEEKLVAIGDASLTDGARKPLS
jgi:hypothetical protein